MGIPLLNEIIIIFGLSVVVLYIFHKLRIPVIVGFILTGIMAGPHGLGLVKAVNEVETLAEIGIGLLLFTIGMEFSFKNLLQIRKTLLMGGAIQVLLTFIAGFATALKFGQPFGEAVFIGFLVSLSSTAIVLKLFQERAEIDSPHGRTGLGILIFQDIIVVPMMLLIPLLGGSTENLGGSLFILMVKGLGIIVLVIIGAKWIVPQVLYQIARTRIRELFLLVVIVICLAVAWLTSMAGLSLALGAFMAGLIISESEYSHQALGNILPFRDVFTSFFFVSIGMLLDVAFLLQHPGVIVLIALGIFVLKTLSAGLATALLGFPLRTAILVGLALSQVGEFSFILSKVGVEYGLLAGGAYQLFLAVTVLTMALTPFIVDLSPRVADLVLRLPMHGRLKSGFYPVDEIEDVGKRDHLIIIGFGVNGRNLARAARAGGIPYVIIEMNPETVRDEKGKGELIYYGDATQEVVLERADIKDARVVVVAINDPTAARRITDIARRMNPKVYIIVRTRYLQELKPLYDLGANEVIPEEFETSVEIFTRVLRKYLMPRDQIEQLISEVRTDSYQMLRSITKKSPSFLDLDRYLQDVEISALRVGEVSSVAGKTVAQIKLRKEYGVTLLAIKRDSQILSNPTGDTQIMAHDVVVVLGTPDKIAGLARLLLNPE
ncbi:MAG: cation:proton antiporter [Thermodesulfobacteriota bacterium]|nr:cation:proton antiporter [Thermodesulfobacteriota bacterium]